METALTIAQIIISLGLIVLILLQQRDSAMSGFLGGGGGGGGAYQQRRGLERVFVWLTVILGILFAATALARVFVHEKPAMLDVETMDVEPEAAPTTTQNDLLPALPEAAGE